MTREDTSAKLRKGGLFFLMNIFSHNTQNHMEAESIQKQKLIALAELLLLHDPRYNW
jgi:hypothetical protein